MNVRRYRGPPDDRQRGAIAVLYAMFLAVLLGLAALALDVGAVRADRRRLQSTVDMAVSAGALGLISEFGGTPYDACEAAWGYLLVNLDESAPASDPCAPYLTAGCLSPPALTPTDVGPYEIEVVWPVPDDSPYMGDPSVQSVDPDVDGALCDRLAVAVKRDRGFVFGPAIGLTEGGTQAHAVALGAGDGDVEEIASLVVLDPIGCKSLDAQGQGKVWVRSVMWDDPDTPESDPVELPGIITVDSAGTDTTSSSSSGRRCVQGSTEHVTMHADDNSSGGGEGAQIRAGVVDSAGTVGDAGMIFSYALKAGVISRAYDPNDIPPRRLDPEPRAGGRVTRAHVDHRYNCKADYPTLGIEDCPDAATTSPHIDDLRAEIESAATTVGSTGTPAEWGNYREYMETHYGVSSGSVCSPSALTDPDTGDVIPYELPAGRWWVACPSNTSSEGGFGVGTNVEIEFGPGNVVFTGKVHVQGELVVNEGGTTSSYMYVRNGSFTRGSTARVTLDHVFLYLHNGAVSLGGGSPGFTWTAPNENGYRFDDLALWSESTLVHDIGGQANLDIEGVFFLPNAQFTYTGQGAQSQKRAQFIVWRMQIGSQGVLAMEPDPNRTIPTPVLGIRLIR